MFLYLSFLCYIYMLFCCDFGFFVFCVTFFFFFKQKTAYEVRISDWSSDVCSSDLPVQFRPPRTNDAPHIMAGDETIRPQILRDLQKIGELHRLVAAHAGNRSPSRQIAFGEIVHHLRAEAAFIIQHIMRDPQPRRDISRSEEHTSELQSLMRSSYAIICL